MLTNSKTIKEQLSELGIRPSKGLGQNFLTADSVYKKIVAAGQVKRGEALLEIGPGLGTLTEHLASAGGKIIAIEKDRKLISFLKSLFLNNRNVTIIEGDALKFNPGDIGLSEDEYKVLANIPYYITSRLLRNIFEFWPRPKLIVLLVQYEVAQRMNAKPPHMNILAISVQYFADLKIISRVSKGSFYPMPQVASAIIKITPRHQISDKGFEDKFFTVIRAGFSSKRKKLVNNLANKFKVNKNDLVSLLISNEISPNARPENLTIAQWQKITQKLFSQD